MSFTKQNFLILDGLLLKDKHFSFEYRSHAFNLTARQTRKPVFDSPNIITNCKNTVTPFSQNPTSMDGQRTKFLLFTLLCRRKVRRMKILDRPKFLIRKHASQQTSFH